MKLKGKIAVVYGGGVIGGAIARAFAREGAHIFLAGHRLAKLDAVASAIRQAGGQADTAEVDALDEAAVRRHADQVAARAGGIDIAINTVGTFQVQGTPLAELALEDYFAPVSMYTRTNFITCKAVAAHMTRQGSGVILMLTTPAARMAGPGFAGHSVACGGVEALTRHMAGELGPGGVRVVCIRSHAIAEAAAMGSHSHAVFQRVADRAGTTVEAMLEGAAQDTLLKRLPSLKQVAQTAVFLASDDAGAMTGAIANLSCGMILD